MIINRRDDLKLEKHIILIEFLVLILFLALIFSAFPNNSKKNLIKSEEYFKSYSLGKSMNIDIENKNYDLKVPGLLRSFVDYNKLKLLERNDLLIVTTRKSRTSYETISGFLGHKVIVALESDRLGNIIFFDEYAEMENAPLRLIFKFVTVTFFVLSSILIIISWGATALLISDFAKYENLINHRIVSYKIVQEKR